jgi:hypothetical protein
MKNIKLKIKSATKNKTTINKISLENVIDNKNKKSKMVI